MINNKKTISVVTGVRGRFTKEHISENEIKQ